MVTNAEDYSLFSKKYQASLKNGADPICKEHVEYIDHLVSGWLVLMPKEYKT